ncbi:MAG: hypothetical protein QHH24_03460 [Candidatus Bathyarchaeota archaeon]|nr:hypothetical protein [Candidatus Bathyarchaeota archaeon]
MSDDQTIFWIEEKEPKIANLAKLIGVQDSLKVKVKITLEVVEEPCKVCGKLTPSNKICRKCGETLCNGCAVTDAGENYCPTCFSLLKTLKLA